MPTAASTRTQEAPGGMSSSVSTSSAAPRRTSQRASSSGGRPSTASGPAASSPRSGSPQTTSQTVRRALIASVPLDRQVEEVRGARDARVVAPDELLDPVRRLGVGQVEDLGRERREVGLDGALVLARRRDDLGGCDPAALVDLVAMEEEARAGPRSPRPRRRAAASTARTAPPAGGSRRRCRAPRRWHR